MHRGWALVTGCCLAVAIGVPVSWEADRPASAAGAPLAVALGASRTAPPPSAPPAAPATDVPLAAPSPAGPPLPALVARPAAPSPAAVRPAPVRLRIPAAGVDAPVDAVGLTGAGDVAVPEDGSRVGWYRFGAAPGSPGGSAVLVGHVDTWNAGAGALFRLGRLDPGAEAVVDLADGTSVRYAVTGRDLLPKGDLPGAGLFGTAGPSRLVLISCGGPFDEATRHYRDNVVVVAAPSP